MTLMALWILVSFCGAQPEPSAIAKSLTQGAAADRELKANTAGSPSEHRFFGRALGAWPDLDGDGVDEIAVGSLDPASSQDLVSSVRLLSGASGALLLSIKPTTETPCLGTSFSRVADLDGDGTADMAIGFGADSAYGGPSGLCFYSGSSARKIALSAGDERVRLGGIAVDIGDISLDGVADCLTLAKPTTSSDPALRELHLIDGRSFVRTSLATVAPQFGRVVSVSRKVDIDELRRDRVLIGVRMPDSTGEVWALDPVTNKLTKLWDLSGTKLSFGPIIECESGLRTSKGKLAAIVGWGTARERGGTIAMYELASLIPIAQYTSPFDGFGSMLCLRSGAVPGLEPLVFSSSSRGEVGSGVGIVIGLSEDLSRVRANLAFGEEGAGFGYEITLLNDAIRRSSCLLVVSEVCLADPGLIASIYCIKVDTGELVFKRNLRDLSGR